MTDVYKQQGAFSWNELMTTDVDSAKKFYGEVFGWQFRDEPMEGMIYTIVKAGEREVGGIMAMPPDAGQMPSVWGAYVTVDDVDETARKVEAAGGQIHIPPQDIPGVGRFCVIQDPQGAYISAIHYTM